MTSSYMGNIKYSCATSIRARVKDSDITLFKNRQRRVELKTVLEPIDVAALVFSILQPPVRLAARQAMKGRPEVKWFRIPNTGWTVGSHVGIKYHGCHTFRRI